MKQLIVFKFLSLFILPAILLAGNGNVLEASKSVIRIITVLGNKSMVSGTAFCVNAQGYFLTNAHVIDEAQSIFAVKSSHKYDVKVIKKLDNIDLAILKIENTGLEPLRFASRDNINVTDRVASIGFPGAADKNDDVDELTTVTINSGIIGKFSKINLSINPRNTTSRSPVVQHDAAVNHGNSGGPLVNECGHVVGVNVQKGLNFNRSDAQIIAGDVVQGIFYAIDVDIVKKALKESYISFLETGTDCSFGSGSMSSKGFQYLVIGGILLLLIVVWSIIYYLQDKKKNKLMDESALSRLVSRKLGERSDKSVDRNPLEEYAVQVKPMKNNLPVLIVSRIEKIVGRSRSAVLHIENPLVSGKHLSLSLNSSDEVVVKDLGSSNGTYIEGKKLTPYTEYTLRKGERLVIGSEDVLYKV